MRKFSVVEGREARGLVRATVALGSNLESRAERLERALVLLGEMPETRLIRKSRVIETEPVEVPAKFAALKFLNQVAVFETGLEVREFSRRMHVIEDQLGRVRTVRNGPRTIDLDLITFGDLQLNDPELTLPHPRAAERDFVMRPLRELWLEELRENYGRYVDGFREADGKLPVMMQLKLAHTKMVERNAELIAEDEGFTDEERFAAVAASLLHDTGRYEQLRRFNTFKDSESVDHAVFSHDIVKERGWLEALGPLAEKYSPAILNAVLYHNRREIPASLDRLTEIAAHTVRDADKLDIFRVLEDQVEHSDWRKDSRAFWNLQCGLPPNPRVVEAVRDRRPVDYQEIRTLADFVLIQVGWMLSGLHFVTSRRFCRARGHLAFRRKFLAEIGGGSEADALCDLVEAADMI